MDHVRTVHQVQTLIAAAMAESVVLLLDFYAPWCGPCKKLEPTVQALVQQYGKKLRVIKLNVDEVEDVLMTHFQVKAVPTFIFVKNNQVVAVATGGDAAALSEKCAQALAC